MARILWAAIVILVVLWLIGLFLHILGAAIHLLLVLAVIVLILQFFLRSRHA
ncbi:MAG: lmo0937 family membrane protein [Chloroflexi bacterium]|nr:lmo0937 family membrane protein [Chloroflexota bacterium]